MNALVANAFATNLTAPAKGSEGAGAKSRVKLSHFFSSLKLDGNKARGMVDYFLCR